MTSPEPAAVCVLDVDGAFSPYAPTRAWPDYTPAAGIRLEVLVSAALAGELAALPAQRAWLTDWGTGANRIGAAVGWPELPVLPRPTTGNGWWKLTALRAWRPRRGRSLIWVDDQLTDHPEAYDWAARLPTPTLLIAPDATTGITPEHLRQIRAFLAEQDR